MNPRQNFIKFTVTKDNKNQIFGSGILIRLNDPDYDLVLTAGHCLDHVEPLEIDLIDIPLDVIKIYRPSDYKKSTASDFGAMIVPKVKTDDSPELSLGDLWSQESNLPEDGTYLICGFPIKKRDNECDNAFQDKEMTLKQSDNDTIVLGNNLDTIDKNLYEGMSGGPALIIDGGQHRVCGIITHTLPNGEYGEVMCVRIEKILRWLQQEDIIYFKDGDENCSFYFTPIIDDIKEDYNELSAILLGCSGHGKSAFAKTFLKNGHMIDVAGDVQTTRSTIIYSASLNRKKPVAQIHFFNKKEFINFRLQHCNDKLNKEYERNKEKNDGELTLATYEEELPLGLFLDYTIRDNEFFNYNELTFLSNDLIDKIKHTISIIRNNIGASSLPCSIDGGTYTSIANALDDKRKTDTSSEDTKCENEKYTLENLAELILEKVYDLTIDTIMKEYPGIKNNCIDIDLRENMNSDLLTLSLKVNDAKSLTGFVKSVEIRDRVSDEYISCFLKNRLHTLNLIDTYGLDHNASLSENVLRKRLTDLAEENKNTDFIFFMWKLSNTSPTQLDLIVPNTYNAVPRFRLYVIFTHIDKYDGTKDIEDDVIDLNKLSKTMNIPEYTYFMERNDDIEPVPHKIRRELHRIGLSESMALNIYENMRDCIVPYCSSHESNTWRKYRKNNIHHMHNLLYSIINKVYLGNGFININHVENAFSGKISSAKDVVMSRLEIMFKEARVYWGTYNPSVKHWNTQQANINSFKRNELGFSRTYNHEWRWLFQSSFNKAFSKLDDESLNPLFATEREGKDASAIQQLMNDFITKFLACHKCSCIFSTCGNRCKECDIEKCFRKILLQAYETDELIQEVDFDSDTRSSWLDKRYNFDDRFEKIKEKVSDYFIQMFFDFVIPQCKEHNNRMAENLLKNKDKEELDAIKQAVKTLDGFLEEMKGYPDYKQLTKLIENE